jgi:hypothetical protein
MIKDTPKLSFVKYSTFGAESGNKNKICDQNWRNKLVFSAGILGRNTTAVLEGEEDTLDWSQWKMESSEKIYVSNKLKRYIVLWYREKK